MHECACAHALLRVHHTHAHTRTRMHALLMTACPCQNARIRRLLRRHLHVQGAGLLIRDRRNDKMKGSLSVSPRSGGAGAHCRPREQKRGCCGQGPGRADCRSLSGSVLSQGLWCGARSSLPTAVRAKSTHRSAGDLGASLRPPRI